MTRELRDHGHLLFTIPFEDEVMVAERGWLSVLSLAELADVIHEELTQR